MTMAVGFLCRDGVVIGADRQVTGSNYTFPECKLGSFRWNNGYAIFAYSGDHDTAMNFGREVEHRLSPDLTLQEQDVRRLIRECLDASLDKRETFLTMVGFWLEGDRGPYLVISNKDRKVVGVPECEVIGYADSPLARSLLGRFRDVPHAVSVHQATMYAVDFISQAKKYDGQYVGDGIDVYSISATGPEGKLCVRVQDPGRSDAIEKEIHSVHYWMDVLFSKLTDKEQPVSLDQFMERIRQFRALVAPDGKGADITQSAPRKSRDRS